MPGPVLHAEGADCRAERIVCAPRQFASDRRYFVLHTASGAPSFGGAAFPLDFRRGDQPRVFNLDYAFGAIYALHKEVRAVLVLSSVRVDPRYGYPVSLLPLHYFRVGVEFLHVEVLQFGVVLFEIERALLRVSVVPALANRYAPPCPRSGPEYRL